MPVVIRLYFLRFIDRLLDQQHLFYARWVADFQDSGDCREIREEKVREMERWNAAMTGALCEALPCYDPVFTVRHISLTPNFSWVNQQHSLILFFGGAAWAWADRY